MRTLVAFVFLLLCCASLTDAQKTRLGAAPPKPLGPAIKIHISATRLRSYCTGNSGSVWCADGLYADAIIAGKKIELEGASVIEKLNQVLLMPGDYQAQPTQDQHNADNTVIHREYDILLPDGSKWHCSTPGITD